MENKGFGGGKKGRGRTAASRIRRGAVAVLLFFVAVAALAGAVLFFLQRSGKSSLYNGADSSDLVGALSKMTAALGGGIRDEETEDWQEGDIRYNGVHYRYNADILTFLFMGIDRLEEAQPAGEGEYGGQSDALFLLVLDPHRKKMSVIGIPRDTMTELEVYETDGRYIGTARGQITLQHTYGDGMEESCVRSVQAVSKLLYGLPVHGYCAINMGAVPLLNDAVGGIRLYSREDMQLTDIKIKEGEEVLLEGLNAYDYVHNRDVSSFNSAGDRLERQVQYLEAYAAAAMGRLKEDITFPISLYGVLERYMVTDISVDEVSYLATQAVGYSFDRADMHTLAGETVMGDRFEEFYVDEKALYELILGIFYEDVDEGHIR